MTAAPSTIQERSIPVHRRASVQFGLVLALLGAGTVAYLTRDDWLPHDERPARAIAAPELGRLFVVSEPTGAETHIAVLSGTRQNERAAGGQRPDRDVVVLVVRYEVISKYASDQVYADQFDWHVPSGSGDPGPNYGTLSFAGFIHPGEPLFGTLTFSGIASGATATITFQRQADTTPLFTMQVAP